MNFIVENKNFVYKMALSFHMPHHLEDLVSAGNIGLVIAHKMFDPAKGVKFLTFAFYYVRAEMQEYVRRVKGERCETEYSDYMAPSDQSPSCENLDSIFRNLSEKERHVLICRFEKDQTLQVIADGLGITKERTRQIEAAAIKKLQKRLGKRL